MPGEHPSDIRRCGGRGDERDEQDEVKRDGVEEGVGGGKWTSVAPEASQYGYPESGTSVGATIEEHVETSLKDLAC